MLAHAVLDGGLGLGQGRSSDTSTSVFIHWRIVLSDLGPHHCMVHVMFGNVEELMAPEEVDRRRGRVREAESRGRVPWQSSATPHFDPASGLPTAVFCLYQVWTPSFMSQSPYPSSLFLWLQASSSSSGKLGEMTEGWERPDRGQGQGQQLHGSRKSRGTGRA